MLCILSTISSGDLARELKEGPARADGAVLLQPARGELIRGVVEVSCGLPMLLPGVEATFWSRSEERRSTGGAGGEEAHGSRGGGVNWDCRRCRRWLVRSSRLVRWMRCHGRRSRELVTVAGSGTVFCGTIGARLQGVVAPRVAVAAP